MPSSDSAAVNPQIIDAMTATSTGVIGEAPAYAMGVVYQTAAQAVAQTMQNQTSTQQGLQQVGVAVVSTAVARIMATPTLPPPPTVIQVQTGGDDSGGGNNTPDTGQASKDIADAQSDLASARQELKQLKSDIASAQAKLQDAQSELNPTS